MTLEKAVITNTVTRERIAVMFNPEEYTLNRDNNFAQIGVPGRSAPIVQFVNGNQQTLEMELFLDTCEAHRQGARSVNSAGDDVRTLAQKVTGLMSIDPATHAPPVLLFTWSSLSFTGVLTRATQRFVMFKPDGTPVRARLTVTFSQYSNADLEPKEVKRETADYTKVHVVRQGETLATIAAAAYGDPRIWRPIALRNGIDDPLRVAPGAQLLLPALPYRDPDSGRVYS
jgi:hypothetical protein